MRSWGVKLLILVAELMAACGQGYALDVWFAPEENCQAVIVAEIDKAEKTIDYQLYNATSQPIGDALIRAEKRGVEVRMLLDARANANNGHSIAASCKAAGCDVRFDAKHPISHNKVRIIDGKIVLSGSFNDSRQANRNAENLTREDEPQAVKEFADNFETHWKHGVKSVPPSKPRARRR